MLGLGIGRLTVLAELGAGAGSRVFHVRRLGDGAEYALKVVPADRRADPRYPDQLRHEYRIGRMLSHPNLTKVYKLEVRRDLLFRPLALRLLLEFAPGRPLDRGPALPLQRAVRVFERIASALEHMHSRGVIHADVKPGNLIFDPERGIKLIDFGLARIARERDFRVRGTPQYMAPETASLGIVTTRTDIYNLGATMYHLVTGRPLPAPMPSTLPGVRIQPSPVVPVDHLIPDAPRRLCEVIHSCTAADPDQRPIGVGEVSRALAGICRAHGW